MAEPQSARSKITTTRSELFTACSLVSKISHGVIWISRGSFFEKKTQCSPTEDRDYKFFHLVSVV